jgi:cell fate regulator YaaT (PSP1 superfamily)
MNEISPVSIKMAKDQNLSLNPMRISGVCGRLLCCLGFESEQYKVMKEKLPKEGQRVSVPMGTAVVVAGNPIKETVLVELESGATVEVPLSTVRVIES